MIENNIYFSNLLIFIEDHPVVLSHTLPSLPAFLPFSLSLSLSPSFLLSSLSSHTPLVYNSFSNSPYSPLFVSSSSLLFNLFLEYNFPHAFPAQSFIIFPHIFIYLTISEGTNEIGIPVQFAKVLHYPTPVNDFNIRYDQSTLFYSTLFRFLLCH